MPLYTQPIAPSPDLPTACERFLADVGEWVRDCIRRYADAPPTNVHDQATYTTGWEPWLRATRDPAALGFLAKLRDDISFHYTNNGSWRHGYWTMQEAHHGTEHFELFLGFLQRVLPDDSETTRQLQDAAEHMGNWSADVPGWFDWERRRFRSLFFGADGVRTEPGMEINTPDHLRCVNICLLAEEFNAKTQRGKGAENSSRYAALAALYAGEWADAILAEERLPLALTPDGVLYDFDGADEAVYRSFAGEVSGLGSPVDRAENFLGSDAVNTFLRLWQRTGDDRFRRATQRLLDLLVTQLDDPDAGAAADAVRAWRRWTDDSRYDAPLLAAVKKGDPFAVTELTLDTDFRLGHRPSGVGKRSDMPRWLEDGAARRHNPITLLAAAEISRDAALAVTAVNLARAYFLLARRAFPDGRDHGCAARTVSAIARGHGRENHAGMATAVLGPALEWGNHQKTRQMGRPD